MTQGRKRGPKSAAELAIVSPVEVMPRPAPPSALTPEQARTWLSVVNRLPADWIPPEAEPLLEVYCVAADVHRRLADELNSFEAEWFKLDEGMTRFKTLAAMLATQAGTMKAMASALRLSPQSRYGARKADTASRARLPEPWSGGKALR